MTALCVMISGPQGPGHHSHGIIVSSVRIEAKFPGPGLAAAALLGVHSGWPQLPQCPQQESESYYCVFRFRVRVSGESTVALERFPGQTEITQ